MTPPLVDSGFEPKAISRAAVLFYNYPRIRFGETDLRVFSLQSDYLRTVRFQALPYLLLGVVLVLLAVVFNTYRYFRRGLSPGADDTKDSDPGKRDWVAKAYVLNSAFICICVLVLIAMCAGANTMVRSSIYNAHEAITLLSDDIDYSLYRPTTLFSNIARNLDDAAKKSGSTVMDSIPKKTAVNSLIVQSQDLVKVQSGANNARERLKDLDEYLNTTSLFMFYGITGILIICISGCFLMYFSDVAPPRAHKVRMLMIVTFAIPLGAAWCLVGFSTVVGQAAGDFCHALEKFHKKVAVEHSVVAIRARFPHIEKSNIFVKYDLSCPTTTKYRTALRAVESFLKQVESNPLFGIGLANIDNTSEVLRPITGQQKSTKADWTSVVKSVQQRLDTLLQCKAHTRFVGTLAVNICGDHSSSAVNAMAIMWLASLGLSMLFGVLVFISSLGQPPAEFATGYEMLHMYGAPKLIRAFGDVGGFVRRQNTFHELAGGGERGDSMDKSKAQMLHVSKSVAEAFTDCAIKVEDDYLVKVSSTPRVTRARSKSILGALRRSSAAKSSARARGDDVDKQEASFSRLGKWLIGAARRSTLDRIRPPPPAEPQESNYELPIQIEPLNNRPRVKPPPPLHQTYDSFVRSPDREATYAEMAAVASAAALSADLREEEEAERRRKEFEASRRKGSPSKFPSRGPSPDS